MNHEWRRKATYPNSSSQNIHQRIPLQIIRELAEICPFACEGLGAERILFLFELASGVVSIDEPEIDEYTSSRGPQV